MADEQQPVLVEIVAYAPTAFYHCTHCEVVWQTTGFSDGLHEEQVRQALPADLQADYQAVSDWVHHLQRKFCDQIAIKIIDAASLEGVWKSARHRLGRYPAVIVGGRRCGRADFATAEAAIVEQLQVVAAGAQGFRR